MTGCANTAAAGRSSVSLVNRPGRRPVLVVLCFQMVRRPQPQEFDRIISTAFAKAAGYRSGRGLTAAVERSVNPLQGFPYPYPRAPVHLWSFVHVAILACAKGPMPLSRFPRHAAPTLCECLAIKDLLRSWVHHQRRCASSRVLLTTAFE